VLSRGHRDELPGPHGHLLAINDDGASTVDDGICILGSVVSVVVADGMPTGRELDLIEPEGADAEGLPDVLVTRTRGPMRPGADFSGTLSTVV
jgi:hypothetical protein